MEIESDSGAEGNEMDVNQREDPNGEFFEIIHMIYNDELSLESNCEAIGKSKQNNF